MRNTILAFPRTTNELIDERLGANAEIHFTVPTASMYPMLVPGDQIVVRGARANQLRLGDIVLAKSGDVWLAHRLIGRVMTDTGWMYITKGDNHVIADPLWSAGQLRGLVLAIHCANRGLVLESKRILVLNKILATLSKSQLFLNQIPENTLRRIGLKISRTWLYAGALLVRRLAE